RAPRRIAAARRLLVRSLRLVLAKGPRPARSPVRRGRRGRRLLRWAARGNAGRHFFADLGARGLGALQSMGRAPRWIHEWADLLRPLGVGVRPARGGGERARSRARGGQTWDPGRAGPAPLSSVAALPPLPA